MSKITKHDRLIGNNIARRRKAAGMSRPQLAERLDRELSPQQIAKYENGTNRCPASTLFDIASVLDTPVRWFHGVKDEDPNLFPMDEQLLLQQYQRLPEGKREGLVLVVKKMVDTFFCISKEAA